jgi:hypothetical protein
MRVGLAVMLVGCVAANVSSAPNALPPPPVAPAETPPYAELSVSVSATRSNTLPDDAELNRLHLETSDNGGLRAQAWIRHDELEQADEASSTAWLGGGELHLIVPLKSSVSPFAPRCCLAYSRVDLRLSEISSWPRAVMLHIERPQLHLLDTRHIPEP